MGRGRRVLLGVDEHESGRPAERKQECHKKWKREAKH
jgi:hypothetical protein